jgi:hypothetical protein
MLSSCSRNVELQHNINITLRKCSCYLEKLCPKAGKVEIVIVEQRLHFTNCHAYGSVGMRTAYRLDIGGSNLDRN